MAPSGGLIELSVLLFTLGVSMAAGVLFGLAPVGQGPVDDLVTGFKDGETEGPPAVDAITSAARSLWSKSRWR